MQPVPKSPSTSSANPAASIIAVVGSTATGKSALGIALAKELGGEVVNADAMQLYRGMDVGTAKLLPPQWDGIPHHALDIWDVTQAASVVEYQQVARTAIDDILSRGRRPIVVGGSGLYVRAAVDDIEFPGTDPAIRARWQAELARIGPYVLHQYLSSLDPASGLAILPSNGRRIVRALEVMELTGQAFHARLPEPRSLYPTHYVGLDCATEVLDARVVARVDEMWEQGLVAEVRALADAGLREGTTASRALGYAQVLRMLDGELSAEEAIALTKQQTRRFVRRQRSWFRRDRRIAWLDAVAPDLFELAVAAIP